MYTQQLDYFKLVCKIIPILVYEMEQTSVNERFKMLAEHFKPGNKSAFAKAIGISNQSLGEILGGRKSAPSFAALQKLFTAFPEVRMEWVILGRGAMLQNAVAPEPAAHPTLTREDVERIAKEAFEAQITPERMQQMFEKIVAEANDSAVLQTLMYYVEGTGTAKPKLSKKRSLATRLGITAEEARQLVLDGKIASILIDQEQGYRVSERSVVAYLQNSPPAASYKRVAAKSK